MGRPSEFKQETADLICDLIVEGKSVRSMCALEDLPAMSTVFKWLSTNKAFAEQYARAKEAQAEHFADELMEIVDDTSGDVAGELDLPNAVAVQRSKLRYEARKWIMSQLLAKKYGSKVQNEHTGKDGEPLSFVVKSILEG